MINEKAYLEQLTARLNKTIEEMHNLDPDDAVDQRTHAIVQQAVETEETLRKETEIGARFSVLHSELKSLLEKIEKEIGIQKAANKKTTEEPSDKIDKNYTTIYVYLFNANGNNLKSWQKLFVQSALFEHSVNRPIYIEQQDIEKMIRARPNKEQQGYLEIIIKKQDVLTSSSSSLHDPFDSALVRLKQGALTTDHIKAFYHNGKRYVVQKDGSLMPV